jgi:hypothetical protein
MFSLKQEFGKFYGVSGDSLNGITDSIRAKEPGPRR